MDPEPPSLLLNTLFKDIDWLTLAPIFLVILALLLLSGLISGSEVSFFSLNSTTKDELKNSKNKNEQLAYTLLERPQRLLATILISNNFVNVGIVILSTYALQSVFNFAANPLAAFIIEIVLVTTLILFFGEIMPKVYATASPIKLAKIMARPLFITGKFFTPLIKVLIGTSALIKTTAKSNTISVGDLEHALELTEDENNDNEEQKILEGIVRFGNTSVRQIMTPRTDVKALEKNEAYDKILSFVIEHGHSRIPVYDDNLDQIKGVLYIKDLLPFMDKGKTFNWYKLLREPFFVPETKKIDDLLTEFQEKKIHLAIVVDEFGGTSGVITLEDVIEEIVGEISDEFDDEDLTFKKLDPRTYLFEGRTPLYEFYKALEIEGDAFEEVKGDSDTLAGLLLEVSGKIPEKMEVIEFNNYQFKVENIENRRIQSIKVTIPEENISDS